MNDLELLSILVCNVERFKLGFELVVFFVKFVVIVSEGRKLVGT